MITSILIFSPFVAALIILCLKGNATKKVAFVAALVEFIVSLVALCQFHYDASVQFLIDVPWISSLGVHFKVGMDGISLLMVLLTTFLVPLIILSSFKKDYERPAAFYALILMMQAALIGTFVALDGFLFYVFWELALVPIYFICLRWGDEKRIKVTIKFFVYTLLGSLFMLVALIYLYLHTPGTHSFDIQALYDAGSSLTVSQQGFVFWAFFIAFAIKMPVFPFHTWQPDTYHSAPTAGTMLLAGIMLKMGIYGLIRWLIPTVPAGVSMWGNTAMILAIIGIVYASCIAIVQKDFKRLVAYSSIAHVGLIAAGVLIFNIQGLQGGVVQMISHGINVVGMFFIVDIIYERMKTREIKALGGIRNMAPIFAVLFMIIMLGTVALPLTNGFVGEFLLLSGIFQHSGWMAAFATTSVFLGAVYMFRFYQNTMLGETNPLTESFPKLTFNEKAVLIPIVIMVIFIGVYPEPILNIAAPAAKLLIHNFHIALK